jgi:DNA-binding response OmpR family regulator
MDGRASRLRKKLQAIDLRWNVVTAWGEGYYLSFDGARPEQGANS